MRWVECENKLGVSVLSVWHVLFGIAAVCTVSAMWCGASCAIGCHTTPKHSRSTLILNSWQGVLFIKCCSFFLQKYLWWLWPKSFIFTSAVQGTRLHNCCFAYFRWWLLCLGCRYSFLLRSLPSRLYLCKQPCTVERCNTTSVSAKPSCRSWLSYGGFALPFRPTNEQFYLRVFLVFQILTSTKPLIWHFLMIL